MSLAIFTATEHRHRFLVGFAAARADVRLVVLEPKQFRPEEVGAAPDERRLVGDYFAERAETERRTLPEGARLDVPPGTEVLRVESIEDARIVDAVRRLGVDRGLVFGTSVIREPLLSALRLVNVHLGVSPHYRGSGTNFWAMADGNLHLVGATLHDLAAHVDAGPILCHVTPRVEPNDTPHTLGCRVIRTAAEQAVEVMRVLSERPVAGVPQWDVPDARLCRRRDFTPRALADFLKRWPRLRDDFLAHGPERLAGVRLVAWRDRLRAAVPA